MGEQACPFNALYWDFFAQHSTLLGSNIRLGMVFRQLQKMQGPQLVALRAKATESRARIETL
ncbi:hypothetical protein [Chitinimonas naiadis]